MVVVAGLVVLLLGGLAVWRVVARRGAKGQLNAPLVAPPAGALTSLVVTGACLFGVGGGYAVRGKVYRRARKLFLCQSVRQPCAVAWGAACACSCARADVEGATPLMEAWPEVMDAALLLHNEVLLVCAREANGYVSATEGDR